MAKSTKSTLIMIAVISLPFWLLGSIFLYQQDMLTIENVLLLLLATPLMVIGLLASTKGPYIVWDRRDLKELEEVLPEQKHKPED